MLSSYLPRITDAQMQIQLASSGAVLIEGAKWCGKTSSARQIAKEGCLFSLVLPFQKMA